ncbi:MAG: hypothetical protein DMG71_11800 [Acidobacteria bacterium]|nr:MAG: hypothetical protein DMG71_11800 [Acidobacteriota bacterium]
MYSPQVLDHFQQPRNAGDLPNPDISVQRENPACGDVLKLTLIIREDRIAQIGFRAKGCVYRTGEGKDDRGSARAFRRRISQCAWRTT